MSLQAQAKAPGELPAMPAQAAADQRQPEGARLDELRQAGAQRFDPAAFHYLDRLRGQAQAGQGRIRQLLWSRWAQELKAFEQRFDRARADARMAVDQHLRLHPDPGHTLEHLYRTGDFRALARAIRSQQAAAQVASLAELVRRLDQATAPGEGMVASAGPGAPAELKTMRHFSKTWSALSVDKQLAQAFEQTPLNAGPINSHNLVLRSLAMMRDISPDYLTRFTSYIDTLLRLEQQGSVRKPAAKRAAGPRQQNPTLK